MLLVEIPYILFFHATTSCKVVLWLVRMVHHRAKSAKKTKVASDPRLLIKSQTSEDCQLPVARMGKLTIGNRKKPRRDVERQGETPPGQPADITQQQELGGLRFR